MDTHLEQLTLDTQFITAALMPLGLLIGLVTALIL